MKLALVLIILVALIALLARLSEPRFAPTVRDPSFFGVFWDEPHAPRRDSTEKLNRPMERQARTIWRSA